MNHVAFLWSRLPDYAARCIRAFIDRRSCLVTVIGTKPNVPIEGMETSVGQRIVWIEEDDENISWSDLSIDVPDLALIGGYSTPSFNRLGKQCKESGGRVVLMFDHNWCGSLRQRLVDPLRHRLIFRRRFDGIFVPGASGIEFARRMGYPSARTVAGLYGADPSVFRDGLPLAERERVFVFVGRLIARKNCLGLANAFLRFAADHRDWRLRLIGVGSQRNDIPEHPSIQVDGFMQPPLLAEALREARCLVLPSLEEHWGLVVHEAALSGCALALTNVVGAAEDFATPENSVVFPAGNETAIESALRMLAGWDERRWRAAEQASRKRAANFGPKTFADGVEKLLRIESGRK